MKREGASISGPGPKAPGQSGNKRQKARVSVSFRLQAGQPQPQQRILSASSAAFDLVVIELFRYKHPTGGRLATNPQTHSLSTTRWCGRYRQEPRARPCSIPQACCQTLRRRGPLALASHPAPEPQELKALEQSPNNTFSTLSDKPTTRERPGKGGQA